MKGYLADSVRNAKHPGAKRMRELLEAVCADTEGQLVEFEVEYGIASFVIRGDKALQAVIDELKMLEGVEVSTVSAFAAQLTRNRNLQAKLDARRAKKASKKE